MRQEHAWPPTRTTNPPQMVLAIWGNLAGLPAQAFPVPLPPQALGRGSAAAAGPDSPFGGSGQCCGEPPAAPVHGAHRSGGESSIWPVYGLRPRWGSRSAWAQRVLLTGMRREEQTARSGQGRARASPGVEAKYCQVSGAAGRCPGDWCVPVGSPGAVPSGRRLSPAEAFGLGRKIKFCILHQQE